MNFNNFYNLRVTKTTSDNSMSSNFTGQIENAGGQNTNTFNIGNEITIYSDIQVNPPTTKIFTGIIEDISFKGKETNEKITLTGRDYTARLQDRTVEPEVYTNLPAGSIVKDIINKYTDDITTTNVNDSDITINRITFNHTPVYDAIKELADLAGYFFYIDVDKDLHFDKKGTTSSNLTFNSGNILEAQFKEVRDSVFNEIWVYGDRYLDNFEETFIAGSPLGGSTFNLLYGPHNTDIQVNGTTQVGAIYGLAIIPPSGVNYLVNFNDQQITFVSGTELGYNSIPSSGGTVFIKYQRALPIVKVGKNQESIDLYKKRVKKIQDKNIKDPATAVQIVNQKLNELSTPAKEGTLKIKNVINVTPGETCIVNLPYHGINNQTFDIIQATYNFEKNTLFDNSSLTIKVNKSLNDATDIIKDLDTRIRRLESQDISNADIITRLEYFTGSVGFRTSGVNVYTNQVTGSAYHLYSTTFVPSINPFHLASGTEQGYLAGSFTGSGPAFTQLSINWSGGYP